MEILSKDFVEFIECCVEHDVDFLIVGGYALAAHGVPRATKDLDVWLLVNETNANKLLDALRDFGMGSLNLTTEDFLEPEMIIQLGYPPTRIDLLTSASGVEFEACWPSRVMIPIGGVEAPFISFNDLLTNKRSSARPQDLVDVQTLERLAPTDTPEA